MWCKTWKFVTARWCQRTHECKASVLWLLRRKFYLITVIKTRGIVSPARSPVIAFFSALEIMNSNYADISWMLHEIHLFNYPSASYRKVPVLHKPKYLILDATSGFSRSLHISSCRMLVDFSVEIKNVQYLSEVDDIFRSLFEDCYEGYLIA